MHSSHFIGGLWGRPAPVVKALATDLANRPFAPTLVFHETLLSFPRSRIGLLRATPTYTRHTLTRREIERETILRVFGFGTSCSMPHAIRRVRSC